MDTLAEAPATTEPREPAAYEPTGIERRLYAALDTLGIAFEPQLPMGIFTLDAYLPAHRLAVEVDGCGWHGCLECGFDSPWDRNKRARDRWRDKVLLRHAGIATVRLPGHDLTSDDATLLAVQRALSRYGITRRVKERSDEPTQPANGAC